MSSKRTEQKLIRVIAEHHLEGCVGKLTIQVASERAGITRQAFNRNYSHLKPYVLGKRPVEELLMGSEEDVRGLLAKCQTRVRDLLQELDNLRIGQEKSIELVRDTYITTLMNSDIALKNSDEIRETLEKQAMHNEILVKENQKLKLELTTARARDISLVEKVQKQARSIAEVIVIEPDLDAVFQKYFAHLDRTTFEDEKDAAIENMLKKANKLCHAGITNVVLFVDCYLSSFRKYSENFCSGQEGKILLVRTPIFNRVELKLFLGKIHAGTPVAILMPFCASEPIIKAQRKFLFRDVPEIEFAAADKMLPPPIQDGYQEVVVYQVKQGD